MNISFEIEKFKGNPGGLINVLSQLKHANCYLPFRSHEVEEIACCTPSSALKYARCVSGSIMPDSEKVFLKNPGIGIRYLRVAHRHEMQDPNIQKRFWKKVVKKPRLLLDWVGYTGRRLSEEEEESFVQNMSCANHYARKIIGGKFPERIHQMILLKSFEQLGMYEKRSLEEYIRFSEGK
jgi:hypothetical protein